MIGLLFASCSVYLFYAIDFLQEICAFPGSGYTCLGSYDCDMIWNVHYMYGFNLPVSFVDFVSKLLYILYDV